jgi:hypothetical protein
MLENVKGRDHVGDMCLCFVCFHGRPWQATDVLQPAGLLYRCADVGIILKFFVKQLGCADVDWMQLTQDECLIAGYSEPALFISYYIKGRKCVIS